MATKGPCWEGFVQKGMKNKNGKQVPNCVPATKGTSSGNSKKTSKTKIKSK